MKYLFILFIKIYQICISPFYISRCRFLPTCSDYSIQCFKKFGIFRGITLTVKRILKCRNGGKFGFDPIPKK